ncbi:MAG: (d)CMP kinase [Candidatus Cryptobacteroides sp.]
MTISDVPAITIAIDGYSSTGKSSFAKRIASELGFHYLDSGALYRAVTLHALENGFISPDGTIDTAALDRELESLDVHFDSLGRTCIGGRCVEKEIRTLRVSGKVSPISAIASVRDYVNRLLRQCGRQGRIVMDGRDIGTTVFPNAELKIFMTADPMVRARRRAAEMEAKGDRADLDEVLANLRERDYIDSHRSVSPLTKAPDAVVLDNSDMTMDDQMEWVLNLIEKRYSRQDERKS